MPDPVYKPPNTVGYYAALIGAKWGVKYEDGYLEYVQAHPGLSPAQAANDYVEIVLVQSLDAAVSAGTVGAAGAEGKIPGALATGAENVYKAIQVPDFLGWVKSLFTRANAVRLAEGLVGGILILVAVAELGKGTAIGNAVKKVPFI